MRIRISKLFLSAAIGAVTCNVYAVAPGFYMGIMGGPATNDANSINAKTANPPPVMTVANPSSSQFGSRAFMGYKVNQYAGVEFGLTYFSTISYSTAQPTCSGTSARVRDFDFVGRFSYPFGGFEPYAKAGAAAVYTMTSGGLNSSPNDCGDTQYNNNIKPTASIGLGYDLSQNWVTDISANKVWAPGSISSMTYFALGISYHFVDKYCGQFLCDD